MLQCATNPGGEQTAGVSLWTLCSAVGVPSGLLPSLNDKEAYVGEWRGGDRRETTQNKRELNRHPGHETVAL